MDSLRKITAFEERGRFGFRNLAKFNNALLAKQAWRIIQNPDTLFARIMKARYFKDVSMLEAKPRSKQSYGWSSIYTGLEIIKSGTRFLVGDGKSINIVNDNIVPTHPPRPLNLVSSHPATSLHDYISASGNYRFWNVRMLQHIDHADRAFLSKINLPVQITYLALQ